MNTGSFGEESFKLIPIHRNLIPRWNARLTSNYSKVSINIYQWYPSTILQVLLTRFLDYSNTRLPHKSPTLDGNYLVEKEKITRLPLSATKGEFYQRIKCFVNTFVRKNRTNRVKLAILVEINGSGQFEIFNESKFFLFRFK